MLRERISLALRRRLPQGESVEQDSQTRAIHLIGQLHNESVIRSGQLMANISSSRLDPDLGWKAAEGWNALTEARKAAARQPERDYSELIEQTQLQWGYAYARELDADAKRAKTITTIKNVVWAVTIVGPVIDGIMIVAGEVYKAASDSEQMKRAIREAEIQSRH